METQNSNITRIVLATALILSVPLIAMQFTDEVDWNLFDFVIIGTLLLGTGLTYELVSRNVKDKTQRLLIALGLGFVLFLIWAELAVGVFGTPFAGS
ncbi:MAG: hypothetical protein K0S20_369 [Patescibacteria group bacterium]|jgi:hypothetical protein|nr:hypothetical protein [Patescibacteria group bacterium]